MTEEIIDQTEIKEALDNAQEVKALVSNYQAVASNIDADFKDRMGDKNYGLDDLPYGEELIRIQPLPAMIDTAISILSNPSDVGQEAFDKATSIVAEVESTLNDFTDLPTD